jgi:LmbE family N-acetylglucosaminyl deacetylase
LRVIDYIQLPVSTTLVISPHLDDAVLSLGGSIARWTAAGERVVVATVFTTGPAPQDVPSQLRRFTGYPARRDEDAGACAAVGAEACWLGQIERAFRQPFLKPRECFTTPPERGGFTTLDSLHAALATLDPLAPDRILVPLGVGNHVDHVATLVAVTEWAAARGWRSRLVFYEDFYALSTRMRRAHPVARQRVWPGWRSPLLHARRLGATLTAIALARQGPAVTAFLPDIEHARWCATSSSIDEQRKLAAIAHYTSQTAAFGGMAGIARALRAYHAWWRGEPIWNAR